MAAAALASALHGGAWRPPACTFAPRLRNDINARVGGQQQASERSPLMKWLQVLLKHLFVIEIVVHPYAVCYQNTQYGKRRAWLWRC
jgi:hypothetical protein